MASPQYAVPSAGSGLPRQSNNTTAANAADKRQGDALARQIANQHRKGKDRKRQRDLLAEMYLLHLDGEADSQWTTIIRGSQLGPAPNLDGGLRCSTNLLRPIVNNYVSYQSAIPYRVLAESSSSHEARDKANIDTIYGNHVIRTQKWNELFAQALYLAVPYGFCPLHAAAREDVATEVYEPLYAQQFGGMRPVFIDCWVGDPWCMVFNTGATRNSITMATYERVLPLSIVQNAFRDVPWIGELKGRRDLPSASRYQRTAKKWLYEAVHGTPVIDGSGSDGEELVALCCYECPPGVLPDYPDGRLVITAWSGVGDTDRMSVGKPLLLHDTGRDGEIPGRRFSFVRLYSDQRYDDVYGYPWITPLDELQVRRNNLETSLTNAMVRASRPQLAVGPGGGADDDTWGFEPDGIVESLDGSFNPFYIEYPTAWMAAGEKRLEAIEQQMFRIGGWQAASRGESKSGDTYSGIVTLSQADDTIHGSMNRALVGTLTDYLELVHALTRTYSGPFPIPVQVAGSDYGYLASSYVYADQLSDEPPNYVVVSGFGSTPEQVAQTLLNMAQTTGADGEPLLTTRQLRQQYPDRSIWPSETDVFEVKKRRANAINYLIRDLCREVDPDGELPDEWVDVAAQQVFELLDDQERIERDDDFQLNIDTLSELVQDTSAPKLVRAVARLRQQLNYTWQAQMAAPPMSAAPVEAVSDQGVPSQPATVSQSAAPAPLAPIEAA